MSGRRSGRRPGQTATRAAILTAARTVFGSRGYDAATTREIATAAGVDPAMISHHFGGKEGLFVATVDFPFDPRDSVAAVLDGPSEEVAERFLRTFLQIWDGPTGASAVALLRSAVGHEWSAAALREFLTDRAIRPITTALEPDTERAAWRGSLVASQLLGLVFARYIVRFEPLASAPPETVIAALAPTIERYLRGEVLFESMVDGR